MYILISDFGGGIHGAFTSEMLTAVFCGKFDLRNVSCFEWGLLDSVPETVYLKRREVFHIDNKGNILLWTLKN